MDRPAQVHRRADGYTQDLASQWTAAYVGAAPGEHVVDVCAALLTDEPRRAHIANGAREYFDKYLARDQLAAYYLATTAEHAAGILTP